MMDNARPWASGAGSARVCPADISPDEGSASDVHRHATGPAVGAAGDAQLVQGDCLWHCTGELDTIHSGEVHSDMYSVRTRLNIDGKWHGALGVQQVNNLIEHRDERVLVGLGGKIGRDRASGLGSGGVSETRDQAGDSLSEARLARRCPRLDAQVGGVWQGAVSLLRAVRRPAQPLTS